MRFAFCCAALLLFVSTVAITSIRAEDARASEPSIEMGAPLTAAELAQLLDVQIWKFKVALPPDAAKFEVRLLLKEKDRDARPFAAGVSGPVHEDTPREILVAIIPVDGSLHDARKVRVVIAGLGVYAGRVEENPLRGMSIGRPATPENQGDGLYGLIGGYEGSSPASSPVSSADKVISLKIEASRDQGTAKGQ